MKHVTYANKALLMDDEAADWLAEYAAVLGSHQQADTVEVRALGMDGNEVDATFVLNASSDLVVESTNSSVEAPGNGDAIAYMRDAVLRLSSPPNVEPHSEAEMADERRFASDY